MSKKRLIPYFLYLTASGIFLIFIPPMLLQYGNAVSSTLYTPLYSLLLIISALVYGILLGIDFLFCRSLQGKSVAIGKLLFALLFVASYFLLWYFSIGTYYATGLLIASAYQLVSAFSFGRSSQKS